MGSVVEHCEITFYPVSWGGCLFSNELEHEHSPRSRDVSLAFSETIGFVLVCPLEYPLSFATLIVSSKHNCVFSLDTFCWVL
jgi:hypothetical protein